MTTLTPAASLREIAGLRPDQAALGFMGREFTYSELLKGSESCARAFAAIGINEGSRVILHMPELPQLLCCFWGLNMLGAAAVFPEGGSIEDSLRKLSPDAIVTTPGLYESFRQLPGLPTVVIARPGEALRGLRRLIYRLTKGRGEGKPAESFGLLNWDGFLQGGKALRGQYLAPESDSATAAIIGGLSISNADFGTAGQQAWICALHRQLVSGQHCKFSL